MGWSQYAAADFLGMSRSNIVHMERKGYIPKTAWERIDLMVNCAIRIREKAASDPIKVLPSGFEPNITQTVEIPSWLNPSTSRLRKNK